MCSLFLFPIYLRKGNIMEFVLENALLGLVLLVLACIFAVALDKFIDYLWS